MADLSRYYRWTPTEALALTPAALLWWHRQALRQHTEPAP